MPTVLGVDGARGRWAVCRWDGPGHPPSFHLDEGPEEVLRRALTERATVVGLDLPLGLLEGVPRSADVETRRYLVDLAQSSPADDARAAGSRLFMTPVREVVEAGGSYADARQRARSLGHPAPSAQAFALFEHVRRWDRTLPQWSGSQNPTLVEVHPELTFARMTGRVLAPKRSARGARQRLAALAGQKGLSCGAGLDDALDRAPVAVAMDDALDAAAAAWTAWRVDSRDTDLLVLPDEPQLDAGRPVRIHA